MIYLEVLQEIYEMLVASLLWYRTLCKNLKEINFVFNNYDPCVTNRVINTHQQTIQINVEDILVLYKEANINSDSIRWT